MKSKKKISSAPKREGLVLLAEVSVISGLGRPGKANECETHIFDEMEWRFELPWAGPKSEQPVVASRLQAFGRLFDCDSVGLQGEGVSGMSVRSIRG